MSFTDVFIKRPVFATVLNVLIVVVGVLAYRNLGVREYPNVSIPVVTIMADYPNASAQIVESDMTFLLEEQLAGVANLDNMTSYSSAGNVQVTLTFRPGTPMDMAMAQVRDRVSRARAMNWPKDAKEPLIEQQGANQQPFFWLMLTSPDYSFAQLTHFVRLHIKNQLQTIKGVATLVVEGRPYTMKIALNRIKMFTYGVSAEDVLSALAKNQVSLPAGKFREEVPVTLKFALEEPEDFGSIVVKKNDSALVLLKDIAEVTLSEDDSKISHINGKPAVFIGIIRASDGNPLQISEAAQKMLPRIRENLPKGITVAIEHDGAKFIRASLSSIKDSIIEAAVLVLLIIFLFLRNLRSTLIPLITIPISLVGTLAFIGFFGYTLNTISLLAMVLAVGLVVDDAIVVLENIHRHMEHGLSPIEAAKKGSREIAFAIVAMTLTLASVYAPMAFVGGTIGQLFVEFAMTLAASVVVSGIVALTLTPMMCSRILKHDKQEWLPQVEVWLGKLDAGYRKALTRLLKFPWRVFAVGVVVIAAMFLLMRMLPSQLAPREDRGVIGAFIEPLPGKQLRDLMPYIKQVEDAFGKEPEVNKLMSFGGETGINVVAQLRPWSERKRHSVAILEHARVNLQKIPSASVHDWNWDTDMPGLEQGGSERGAALTVSVMTTESYGELAEELDRVQKILEKDGKLINVWHDMHLDYPGLNAKIDHNKMALLELSPSSVARAMETMFDKSEMVEFLKDGLRYKVTLRGDESPTNLHEVYVTNAKGEKIPLSTVVELVPTAVPGRLTHTNQMRSAGLGAQLAPGQNLGSAVKYLQRKLEAELPHSFSYELTGAAKLHRESSNLMLLLFAMALIFIYCVMAIQFESFVDPFVILLTVPLAMFGALLFLWLSGQSINIFSQIGLITLVGLITKHGILIVDFANQRCDAGATPKEAIVEAAASRLRPVLMTTGAMVFGSIPLMIASGAGSEARQAIGYVLVGGLSFGTLLTLFVIPSIYLFFATRKRRVNVAALSLLLLLVPSIGRAQEAFEDHTAMVMPMQRMYALQPTDSPKQLTLIEAIALAQQNNENMSASREGVNEQRGLRRQTLGRILPKLEGRAQLLYQNQASGPVQTIYGFEPQATLGVRVPLVDAPGIVATQNGYSQVHKAEATLERTQQTLALDVAQRFLAVVTLGKLVAIAESQLARAQAKAESVERRHKAGDVPALDWQRAKLLAVRAGAHLQNEKANYQLALGDLGYYVGERAVFDVIAPKSVESGEGDSVLSAMVERAKRNRQDLKAQALAVKIADRSYLAGWLHMVPSLDLSANLLYPMYNPTNLQQSASLGQSLMLQITLPFYDGGVRYGIMQEAAAKTRAETFRQSLLEREIALEIQGSLTHIERQKKLLSATEAALELAKAAQKSAENMYNVGHATSLDLTNAQTELFRSENNTEVAKLNVEQARLSLAYVLGEKIEDWVD